MKKILSITLVLSLVVTSCASSWEQRQKLHAEYLASVNENGYEASFGLKKKLENYDSIYRELAHEMIFSNDFIDKKSPRYTEICNLDCGPFIEVLEEYLLYRNTSNLDHIDSIFRSSRARAALFIADGIIRPDLIPEKQRLAFFPDHGIVRSIMLLLSEPAKKGDHRAHSLLVQLEMAADGENKSIAREYLGY